MFWRIFYAVLEVNSYPLRSRLPLHDRGSCVAYPRHHRRRQVVQLRVCVQCSHADSVNPLTNLVQPYRVRLHRIHANFRCLSATRGGATNGIASPSGGCQRLVCFVELRRWVSHRCTTTHCTKLHIWHRPDSNVRPVRAIWTCWRTSDKIQRTAIAEYKSKWSIVG